MRVRHSFFAAASLFLLCGVTSAQDEDSGDAADSDQGRVCVSVRAIRSFDAFDDEHVYVREGSSNHYLFTMRSRCPGLRYSYGIAIKDVTTRVCSDSFGEIVYRDRAGGQRVRSCPIGKIVKVENKAAAEALAGGETDGAEPPRAAE